MTNVKDYIALHHIIYSEAKHRKKQAKVLLLLLKIRGYSGKDPISPSIAFSASDALEPSGPPA